MREEKYEVEPKRQNSRVGTAISFLLVGLGAGALVGFLYAPRTGKEVRKELRHQFDSAKRTLDDWTGDAKDLTEEVLERGVELAEELKEKVGPLFDQIRRG
ncbi:MAG: YtxH domain-containing protein [Terriglobales bacterium]